ncbi:MAG: M3 family oligoendopeptidase [Thaumarchaeota archaeon]|nr:M3 family oligoendopeptidase [Nitrososphaerota archaeon]
MRLDYAALPRDYERRFVPSKMSFEWGELEGLYGKLQRRGINSVSDLESWLRDESELDSAVSEENRIRYVRNASQTDDSAYEKAYLQFVDELEPRIKLKAFELNKKYVSSPYHRALSKDYFVLDRSRENSVSLFRKQNVELEKREAELTQRYLKLVGVMTVDYRGQRRTLYEMNVFSEDTDRGVRQEAWGLSEKRMLKDKNEIDRIYDGMLKLRDSIAKNAGFGDYRDYAFREMERFDYTPQDCFRFHDAVERYFVPLSRYLNEERKSSLKVESLRPWDLSVDPLGMPPLCPFATTEELVRGCAKIFERIDISFAKSFSRMVALNLLDLESRAGKAPGGFMIEFPDLRLPFIFMNSVGMDEDIWTLLHESGHAFHAFETRNSDLLFDYRSDGIPVEFSEVASTAMEFVGGEHLEGTFYSREDARRSFLDQLKDVVQLFCSVATIDSFQHWVYTHPGHTVEEREDEWVRTFRRFSVIEDWEGYEPQLRNRWQNQPHLFDSPFYYIEYGIATLAALGIWLRYEDDPTGTIEGYRGALALGGSRPLPELFEAAGLRWDFGPATVSKSAGELQKALNT